MQHIRGANCGGGVAPQEVDRLYERLKQEAESAGYHLNPDLTATKRLVEGLLVNERRYGYWACPCRLASGDPQKDLDIVWPCDYRDPDLNEHGLCYCALYVSEAVLLGERKPDPVPERRPPPDQRDEGKRSHPPEGLHRIASIPLPVWRCRVCGYLCGRADPPEVCPICKAKKDRVEWFI